MSDLDLVVASGSGTINSSDGREGRVTTLGSTPTAIGAIGSLCGTGRFVQSIVHLTDPEADGGSSTCLRRWINSCPAPNTTENDFWEWLPSHPGIPDPALT
jgi:hypothetical protein